MTLKTIHVACAIIEKDGLVLAAQRSENMSLPLKWEFPGGKIEAQESAAECLERELWEELSIGIHIEAALPSSHWRYTDFAITLYPFICRIRHGRIQLAEHKAILWIKPEEMRQLDWADADGPVLENYFSYLRGDIGAE